MINLLAKFELSSIFALPIFNDAREEYGGKVISWVVPNSRKAEAVNNALYGPVSTDCPASILRTHPNTVLFLDENSASELKTD